MATVLNSNNINLISQTPALGKVYPNGMQPQIKGAFINNGGQLTQVYPPILPALASQYSIYTDIQTYEAICITIDTSDSGYFSGGARGEITWHADKALPFNVTLYYRIAFEFEYHSYGEYSGYDTDNDYDSVQGTVTIPAGNTYGTVWDSYDNYFMSNGNYYDKYIDDFYFLSSNVGINGYTNYIMQSGNYYIYMDGYGTPPTASGSTSYVIFPLQLNKLPKYLTYTGNIYPQQNLFNLTYMNTSSYSTNYNTYTVYQYPSSVSSCYFNINGSGTNVLPISGATGYSAATSMITRNLYIDNLPFRCPSIGYTYTSTSYYLNRSDFGYYFCGYFSTNTSIVPWSGDPMIDSSYTLFDYNSYTKVTRYKIKFTHNKVGWITERVPTKYSMSEFNSDPFYNYPSTTQYITGTTTKEINNGTRFIYLSTSNSLTFKITSEGNYADISTGTFYVRSGSPHTAEESFGWSSGGATPHNDNSRYLTHGTDGGYSATYPCWMLSRSISSWSWTDTSRTFSLYIDYGDGSLSQAQSLLRQIYSSLTVTLHVVDRATRNNFTWTDSGSRAYIDLDYTYRRTPTTVYVYEIGNSSPAVKKVTFVAKQLGSFTLYWSVSECQYVVRDFKTN